MGAAVALIQVNPLIIPYKGYPDGSGSYLYSATLDVQIALVSPNAPRSKRFEAVIDSGASRCVFHSEIGKYLGVDFSTCDTEEVLGIGGAEKLYLSDVALVIPGGTVLVKAGFKDALPVAGLLGMSGFFEHFNITFRAGDRSCVLDRIYRT